MTAADRPTRLIFVDRLAAGHTVIIRCLGSAETCLLHVEHDPAEHDLTILDTRTTTDGAGLVAIVVDAATGGQAALRRGFEEPVWIYADAGPEEVQP